MSFGQRTEGSWPWLIVDPAQEPAHHQQNDLAWRKLAPSPVPWRIIKTEGKYFSGPLNMVILIPCNQIEQALNLHHESP
jgi:hypothetical protein